MKSYLLALTTLVFSASAAPTYHMQENNIRLELTAVDTYKNKYIYPVSITLTNKTDNPISISPHSINALTVIGENIYAKFKKPSTKAISFISDILTYILGVTYLVESRAKMLAAVIGGPSVDSGWGWDFGNPFSERSRYAGRYPKTRILSGVALVVFCIAGLKYGLGLKNMKDECKSLSSQSYVLQNRAVINPGDVVDKVIFIDAKSWNPKIDFTVFNEDGSQVVQTFHVNIAG